jgi:hypothetical protein
MQPSLSPFAGQTTFMPPHASQESVWRPYGLRTFHARKSRILEGARWTGEWLAGGTLMYWYTVAEKGESNSSYAWVPGYPNLHGAPSVPALGGVEGSKAPFDVMVCCRQHPPRRRHAARRRAIGTIVRILRIGVCRVARAIAQTAPEYMIEMVQLSPLKPYM